MHIYHMHDPCKRKHGLRGTRGTRGTTRLEPHIRSVQKIQSAYKESPRSPQSHCFICRTHGTVRKHFQFRPSPPPPPRFKSKAFHTVSRGLYSSGAGYLQSPCSGRCEPGSLLLGWRGGTSTSKAVACAVISIAGSVTTQPTAQTTTSASVWPHSEQAAGRRWTGAGKKRRKNVDARRLGWDRDIPGRAAGDRASFSRFARLLCRLKIWGKPRPSRPPPPPLSLPPPPSLSFQSRPALSPHMTRCRSPSHGPGPSGGREEGSGGPSHTPRSIGAILQEQHIEISRLKS